MLMKWLVIMQAQTISDEPHDGHRQVDECVFISAGALRSVDTCVILRSSGGSVMCGEQNGVGAFSKNVSANVFG
ncbi:hypothetical protein [uncultured Ruminococcus sp.]|uniref:hypothetical protein n=1 Tax=uncultured Ruminococcus sp. TaxID=165186 RepID=UPI000EE901EA|nr:hypothetical protein [uncultured Ruminococcus sp.]HCJ42129.1 hypothetical protein [Ruminococcus sp.]